MAAIEDNFAYSSYVSDDGGTYSLRTLAAWAATAISGGTTTSVQKAYGPSSRRRHPRKLVFADLTAPGRKVTVPSFTPTAFGVSLASLGTVPQTFSRAIRGEVALKVYTLVACIPEKVPSHTITSAAAQGT